MRFFPASTIIVMSISLTIPSVAVSLPIAVGKNCSACRLTDTIDMKFGSRTCRVIYCETKYPFTCSSGPDHEEACLFGVWGWVSDISHGVTVSRSLMSRPNHAAPYHRPPPAP